MVRVVVDGRPVSVPDGGTLLHACRVAGAPVPALCHMEGLSEVASCRACLVEVAGAGGDAASVHRVPACATPAADGMRVSTDTPGLRLHRRAVAEMLFAGGHHVCAFCPASGRCELQDLGRIAGLDEVRTGPEIPYRPVDASRPRFALDAGRCILCTRCVRACAELEGAHALGVGGHGVASHLIFDGACWGESRACTDCGRCVAACPTGALFEKAYAAQGMRARHLAPAPPAPSPASAAAAAATPSPPPARRLRLATAWLAGCSGCHMAILDLDARLLDLASRVELVYGPLVDVKDVPADIDVCLVEGAVSAAEHRHLLRRLRARSRLLVALGDCAVTGNVTAMRDGVGGAAAVLARSWSGPGGAPHRGRALPVLTDRVVPLRDVVRVDLALPGCPPHPDLVHLVLADLAAGRRPALAGLAHFG